MAEYLVTFVFDIDENRRPRDIDFPKQLFDPMIIAADNKLGLIDTVNKESLKYIRMQGVSVRKDPYAMEKPNEVDVNRMFVPLHMITHFYAQVRPITGEIPDIDGTGLASLPSGKEIVKQ
jgi:hypothetical protein